MRRFVRGLNKVVSRLNQVIFLGILVGVVYFIAVLVMLLHQQPAKYFSFTIHQSTVTAGDSVSYDFRYCRYVGQEVQTNVVQNLVAVDAKGGVLKGVTPVTLAVNPNVSAGKGCATAKNRSLTIPQATSAGCYRVHRIGQYYKLIGFKPASVDIYSNVVCVRAYKAPDALTQLRAIEQQLNELAAQTGVTLPAQQAVSEPASPVSQTPAPASQVSPTFVTPLSQLLQQINFVTLRAVSLVDGLIN